MSHHLLLVLEFILLSIALFGSGYTVFRTPTPFLWGGSICVFICWLLVILEMAGQI